MPRLLFGLANHDIVTFLKGETGKAMGYTISANDSMGNKLTKVGHWTREMKKAIIGCISGSFGLI